MNYFTKDEIELLKQAEQYFKTVIKYKYKSASPIKLNQLVAQLYDSKTKLHPKYNFSCSKCMYTLFNNCGKLYFESKEYWEKKALEETKIREVEQVPTEPKKRSGRPRKSSKKEE